MLKSKGNPVDTSCLKFVLVLLSSWLTFSTSQLVINIKNQVSWNNCCILNKTFPCLTQNCKLFIFDTCNSSKQILLCMLLKGGDVLQEVLASNVSEDTVQLEYQRADGTIVTQLLDFRKEVQIYRLLILAEEEQVNYKKMIS